MASVNIHGNTFKISEDPSLVVGVPMTEGHVKALQQSRVASLRNRFTQTLKGKEIDAAKVQADINTAAEAFQFGASMRGKSGGRRVTDPVEREAVNIARNTIAMAYEAKHGTKLDAASLREAGDLLMAQRGDEYRKRARQVLRDRAAAGTDVLDAIGLTSPEAQAA